MKRILVFAMLLTALAVGMVVGVRTAVADEGWDAACIPRYQVPALNEAGGQTASRFFVEVQNVGTDTARAVLVLFGGSEYCEPQAPGPIKVECSGLLEPGAAWHFSSNLLPATARSGIVYAVPPEAAGICQELQEQVVSDLQEFLDFDTAFREGLDWAGFHLAGGSPLAVEVQRTVEVVTGDGLMTASYTGVAPWEEGEADPVFGGYSYYTPMVYAGYEGRNSFLYIQNSGDSCTSVELWFKRQDDCLRSYVCSVLQLAPGETATVDAAGCIGGPWQGSAWIRASQPLGVVVDSVADETLTSYNGVFGKGGSQINYGPLIFREQNGWSSLVAVQNLSSIVNAKVKVYFLDNGGAVITNLVDWICPRGSQTFFLPVINNLPGQYAGQVRVESQGWWSPGDPPVPAPPIQSVVLLEKYAGPALDEPLEAIAYNALTEGSAGAMGVASLLNKATLKSQIALVNLNQNPGLTNFAIYIYDQNGLVDFFCETLNEKQVELIRVDSLGILPIGFGGSAVVVPVWTDQDGGFKLGGVNIALLTTTLGYDVPGDSGAGSSLKPVPCPFGGPFGACRDP